MFRLPAQRLSPDHAVCTLEWRVGGLRGGRGSGGPR